MQADQGRPRSLNLEDYIILAPGDAPGEEVEYCIQDESRPKLFDLWGYVVPIGRGVTSLVSSFIDNNIRNPQSINSHNCSMPVEIGPPEVSKSKGNKPLKASVSDDYQPSTQESKLDPFADEAAVANEFRGYGNARQRRKSLKKSNAVSSFGESSYVLHRFKLASRENSLDDYLVLKVKSRQSSIESLVSSPTQEKVLMKDHFDAIEKDSPVHLVNKSPLDHHIDPVFLPPCGRQMESVDVLLKRPSGIVKSYSEPSKADIVPSDSLTRIHLQRPTSFPPDTCDVACPVDPNKERAPSESEIQSIVKKHCEKFVEFSNWDMLLPHLETEDLLDPQAKETLASTSKTNYEKSIYFYFTVLPSKGRSAYTSFYKCIVRETKHKGHQTLQEYLKQT